MKVKRLGRLSTRKGILNRFQSWIIAYARSVSKGDQLMTCWVAIMGASSFVECLMGLPPSWLLEDVYKTYKDNVPGTVSPKSLLEIQKVVEKVIKETRTKANKLEILCEDGISEQDKAEIIKEARRMIKEKKERP